MEIDIEEGVLDLDKEFVVYSVLYSIITVIFAMSVLSKFLMNEIRLGFRSALSLVVLFIGEPLCHFLLKGPGGVLLFGFGCVMVYSILPASHLPVDNKAVLITGCDSGFGHNLTKVLDGIGMQVFAGCLHSDGPGAIALQHNCSPRMKIVQLDVTKQTQVDQAVTFVTNELGEDCLWGLVNNAGTWTVSEIEMTSVQTYQKLIEINVMGMVRVTKAFLPHIRKSRGRIVNTSSLVGKIPMKLMGAYSLSKHAVEGFSDVLRMEMKKWGVCVSVIQPGGYQTEALDDSRIDQEKEEIWKNMDESTRKIYGEKYHQYIFETYSQMKYSLPKDISPVIRAMRSGLLSKRPREKYPCGTGIETMVTVFPILPLWLSDRLSSLLSPFNNRKPAELDTE